MHTHGIRGADICGIVFDGAHVPDEALVGTEGGGIETVLKALQLTRTMCAGAVAGRRRPRAAPGRGLRRASASCTAGASSNFRRPAGRWREAAADVLAAEALAVVAARAVHTLTGELSVTSAVTKYLRAQREPRTSSRR